MRTPDYSLLSNTPDQRRLIYHVEYYSEPFLIFLSRNLPDFSSHGIDHTIHIIDNLNEFIKNWEIELTQDEALLLYLAAWLHDIGCIVDREKHHEVSADLFLSNINLVKDLTARYAICLKYIVKAHRARYPIESVPKEHENVRLRLISAIFRLMDACEICYPKCPKDVYEIIKDSFGETARTIWIAHMNILSLKFTRPRIQISVNDIDKCQFIIDNVNHEIDTIRDTFLENDLPIPIVKTI
ncbi:MAG: hypothetical protein ABSD81_06765 [Methanomicrobiales archaeon]|jgi:hypothetical protein